MTKNKMTTRNIRIAQKLKKRTRFGVSEVVGAILLIAVTMAVGLGAWVWARSAATNSELNFGNAVGSNINYLRENFEIIYVNYSSTVPGNVTAWFYNNGNATVFLKQIWISNSTYTFPSYASLSATKNTQFNCYCMQVNSQSVVSIRLNLQSPAQFKSGVLYTFKALGVYGNTNTYQQTK